MYVTLWSNPLTEVTQSRNKWQWLRQRHHSPCWVACFVHTDGNLTWKTIQVIIFQRGKQKNLRWDWLRWDWGSLGWQGFVMFVKHATRDGVISVKAASECQTSHCGSTPVTPLDNRFEADTVWFPRAALFYVVRAPRSVLCGNTLVSRTHTFQTHVHAATLVTSLIKITLQATNFS